jgi:hypothetical protein
VEFPGEIPAEWWEWARYLAILVAMFFAGRALFKWIATRGTRQAERKLHDALARGDLRRAGDIQVQRGLYLEASRIYERGGELVRAARALVKHGDSRAAAIAFEKAGDYASAAPLFQASGDPTRAAECYAQVPALEPAPAADVAGSAPAYELTPQKGPVPERADPGEAHSATLAAPVGKLPPQPSEGPRFELLGELGRGGMGVVHKARDHRLDRMVALKFLPADIDPESPLIGTFRREARAAAALSHPGIVTIYDVGDIDGRDFIAMELVEGTTLEKLLEEKGPLSPLEAVQTMERVLEAVEFAHSKAVIHRDLKPANIMRTKTGIKVMDFGLAKFVGMGGASGHTIIGGTPAYMPPEQRFGATDHRADIFSLGAMFYELLTNVMPGTPEQPASAVTGYPTPKDRVPAVPAKLSDLIMRCLEHDQVLRPQEVLSVLREVRETRISLQAAQEELRAFVLSGRPPPVSPPSGERRPKAAQPAPIPREEPAAHDSGGGSKTDV